MPTEWVDSDTDVRCFQILRRCAMHISKGSTMSAELANNVRKLINFKSKFPSWKRAPLANNHPANWMAAGPFRSCQMGAVVVVVEEVWDGVVPLDSIGRPYSTAQLLQQQQSTRIFLQSLFHYFWTTSPTTSTSCSLSVSNKCSSSTTTTTTATRT